MADATKKLSVTVPVITHEAIRVAVDPLFSTMRRRLFTTHNKEGSTLAVFTYDPHLVKHKALVINLVGSLC